MSNNAKDYLTDDVRKEMKGFRLNFHEEDTKYSKLQFAKIYKGYDFLENIFTIRTYVQKKYNIDWPTLELLLKLMGMKIFTRAEYSKVPKDFSFSRFNTFLEMGYINIISNHTDVEQRLFILNTKAKNIVVNFYKYLSGEKRIPEDGANNPLANKNKQVAFDKKKMALIKKMNKLPIPDHKKKLFKS